MDTATNKNLPSGLGFIHFLREDLAVYALKYLNGMQFGGTSRGIIADFCIEDARAVHKREKKIDDWRKKSTDAKKIEEKEVKIGKVVSLGKKTEGPEKVVNRIDTVSDIG